MAEFNYPQVNIGGGARGFDIAPVNQMQTLPGSGLKPLADLLAVEDLNIGNQKKQLDLNTSRTALSTAAISAISNSPIFQPDAEGNFNVPAMEHQINSVEQMLNASGMPTIKGGPFEQMKDLIKKDPSKAVEFAGVLRNSMIGNQQQQANILSSQNAAGTDIYGNPTVNVQSQLTGQLQRKTLPLQSNNLGYIGGNTPELIANYQAARPTLLSGAMSAKNAEVNIDNVLTNLPKAQTGKYSDVINAFQAGFGNVLGDTDSAKAVAARDIIQKNIADLGLQKNAALGGKFAAELQQVDNSLANVDKQPEALAKSMYQLKPIMQHVQNYQKGYEAVIANPALGIQAITKYNNEMADAFDPRMLQLFNAFQSGGEEGMKKSAKDLGIDLNLKTRKELQDKMIKYNNLSKGIL